MTDATDDVDEFITRLSGIRQIVINASFGGFGLSDKAIARYAELSGISLVPVENEYGYCTAWYKDSVDDKNFWSCIDISRDDKHLVQVVRELGANANDCFASLKIVEIPADVEWVICDYDGQEWIAEAHRTWS
jgi:hypothetical protein